MQKNDQGQEVPTRRVAIGSFRQYVFNIDGSQKNCSLAKVLESNRKAYLGSKESGDEMVKIRWLIAEGIYIYYIFVYI